MTPSDLIRQRITFIKMYDDQINSLKSLRSEHTNYFETLAHKYLRTRVQAERDERCCTACVFVYSTSNTTGLHFGTWCTWCGTNAGAGITVPWATLDTLVTKETA